MKTIIKRLLTLLMALIIVFSCMPVSTIFAKAIVENQNSDESDFVTRAQWLTELTKVFEMTVEEDNYPDNYFADIEKDSPYYYPIILAVEFGVIDLEAGSSVYPESPASREFAAQTLNYCLGYEPKSKEYSFSDSEEVTYKDDVQVAVERKWFELNDDAFSPEMNITSSEKDNMLSDARRILESTAIDADYNNMYEFSDDVIVLPENTEVTLTEYNILTITDCETEISKGDKFVVWTGDLPSIYMAQEVSQEDNNLLIETRKLSKDEINDSIISFDAEGFTKCKIDYIEPAEGVEVEVVKARNSGSTLKKAKSVEYTDDSIVFNKDIEITKGVKANLNIALTNINIKYKYNLSDKRFYVMLTADSKINSSAKFDFIEAFGKKTIDLGEVVVGAVGRVKLSAELALNGKVTVVCNGMVQAGMDYSQENGFRIVKSFKKSAFNATIEAEASCGLVLSAGIDLVIVDGYIYTSFGITGTFKKTSYSDDKLPLECTTVKAWLYFKVGAKASAIWSSDDWNKEFTVYNENNSPVRLSFHIEDKVRVSECSRNEKVQYVTLDDSSYGSCLYGSSVMDFSGKLEHIESVNKYYFNPTNSCFVVTFSAEKDLPELNSGWKISILDSNNNVIFSSGEIRDYFKSPQLPYHENITIAVSSANLLDLEGFSPAGYPYIVSVIEYENPILESEYNNSISSANLIEKGKYRTGTFQNNSDVDYYKFETEVGNFSVNFIPKSVLPSPLSGWVLKVYDKDLDEIYGSDEITTSFSTVKLPYKGTFYVKILPSDSFIWYCPVDIYYNISFTEDIDPFYESEYNNRIATANPIDMNMDYYGAMQSNGDIDYFKFQATGSYFTFEFSSVNALPNDMDGWIVKIYDEKSNVIAQTNTIKSSYVSSKLPYKGTYYACVYPADRFIWYCPVDYTYKIKVNDFSDPYETEYNNSVADANYVKSGKMYTGAIQSRGDVDYYKFENNQKSFILNFSPVNIVTSGSGWRLTVYDESYEQVLVVPEVKKSYSSFVLPYSGTCYLKVENNAGPEYNFSIEENTNKLYEKEYNDKKTTATPIELGKTYTGALQERFDGSKDTDYYKLKNSQCNINVSFNVIEDVPCDTIKVYAINNNEKILIAEGMSNFNKKDVCVNAEYIVVERGNNTDTVEYILSVSTGSHKSVITDKAVAPTCIKTGLTEGSHCSNCGVIIKAQETVKATGKHSYKNAVTKATLTKNGKIIPTCTGCDAKKTATTVYYPKTFKLSATSFVYDGKAKKPTVTVTDANGKVIANTNYTLSYSANTEIGTSATVKITFKGNYSGSKSIKFKIVPAQVTGLKASSVATTSIKLSWTKVSGAKYYKVEQSTDGKKWTVLTTTDKTTYTFSKLTAGSKMQLRVTALDSTKKIAGKASTVLKTGTKTVTPVVTLKSSKSKTATATWKKVTGASKYIVYKSTDNKKWTKVGETTKLTYDLTKLTGGKKIYVKVVAVNAYKVNSADSKVVNVTVKK